MLLYVDYFACTLLTCAGRSAEELSGTHLEAQRHGVASMDVGKIPSRTPAVMCKTNVHSYFGKNIDHSK